MARKVVFINGRFLSQPHSGVQRFAFQIVKGLSAWLDKGTEESLPEFVLLIPRDVDSPPTIRKIRVRSVGALTGHLWDQIDLPLHSASGLLLSMCGTGPIVHRRQIIVFHDASIFANPENFSLTYQVTYKALQRALARTAHRIITVSEFSRMELSNHLKVDPQSISIVPNGADHIDVRRSDDRILAEYSLKPYKYVFALGNFSINKNFDIICRCAKSIEGIGLRVVIAGGGNRNVFRQAYDISLAHVTCIKNVSDAEICALYRNALCFVFPSFYEGFGIPPLEAMRCQCPAIVSHIPALQETCGDAALYCDPRDSDDLISKIKRLANDSDLREDLRTRGVIRASAFSWQRATLAIIEVVRELW